MALMVSSRVKFSAIVGAVKEFSKTSTGTGAKYNSSEILKHTSAVRHRAAPYNADSVSAIAVHRGTVEVYEVLRARCSSKLSSILALVQQ